MKKIGYLTITDNFNLGNRLQCYAVYSILSQYGIAENIANYQPPAYFNKPLVARFLASSLIKIKKTGQFLLKNKKYRVEQRRRRNFNLFNVIIKQRYSITVHTDLSTINNYYDLIATGSDQVWNPNFSRIGMYINMLGFVDSEKKLAVSPSVSVTSLSEQQTKEFAKYLPSFHYLSCREESGSLLIRNICKKQCETLIDPTMLVDVSEWDQLAIKPSFHKADKYILVYFLGNMEEHTKQFLNEISNKYNLDIINILDINTKYYCCGPAEFLYLVKNCSVMVTDSFHGTVFSYLYNRPLRIFDRVDSNIPMNTRIDNFLRVFRMNPKVYYNNYNSDKLFKTDYDYLYLETEKEKYWRYLNKTIGTKLNS